MPPAPDDFQPIAFHATDPFTPDAADAPPSDILVAPYGTVCSTHGNFIVDDDALHLTIAAFTDHATDLPIDFEHQSLGGPYSSPNGLAPAAGWIKSLYAVLPVVAPIVNEEEPPAKAAAVRPRTAAPTDDAHVTIGPHPAQPAAGLWARVEWTPQAADMLLNKQYRYLSPVALVRRSDQRMIALHSVALTNKPAIVGMLPIVNRTSLPARSASEGVFKPTRSASEGVSKPTRSATPYSAVAGAAVTPSPSLNPPITAPCGTDSQSVRPMRDTDSQSVQPITCGTDSQSVRPTCGTDSQSVRPMCGTDSQSVQDSRRIPIQMPSIAPDSLHALRTTLRLDADTHDSAVLLAATQRIESLQHLLNTRAADDRVQQALAAGKLAPAQHDWAAALALRDPAAFDDWFASAPVLVPLGRTAPPLGDAAQLTDLVRRRARDEYRDNAATLSAFCSEDAYIADALRREGA